MYRKILKKTLAILKKGCKFAASNQLKHTTMNEKKFKTQKEAVEYYGHTWKYIEKHYHVSRCYDNSGFRGYFIKKQTN